MDLDAPATMRAVLLALADLAPTGAERTPALSVPTDWFRWLPISALRLFGSLHPSSDDESTFAHLAAPTLPTVPIEHGLGERLAALDQIRAERPIRVGWLWVAGRAKLDGDKDRAQRIFHPLVTAPVRVQRALGTALVPVSDFQISDLVVDHEQRFALEKHLQTGGGAFVDVQSPVVPAALLPRLPDLGRFARTAAHAAGLPAGKLVPATESPEAFMRRDGVVIVAGVGVFVVGQAREASRASSLRAWANRPLDTWTALHSLYLESLPPGQQRLDTGGHGLAAEGQGVGAQDVESPAVLSPVQRAAVATSRTAPVTLLSGAPGTGKSHTIAAIACDALARGEKVLVAAKTDATVDALLSLLERGPGPSPVVFGSNERRDAMAARLSGGQLQPLANDTVEGARKGAEAAARQRDDLRRQFAGALAAEAVLAAASNDAAAEELRRRAPGFFAPGANLDEAAELLAAVSSQPAGGWWARHREHHAWDEALALAAAPPDTSPPELQGALAAARAWRAADDLAARGGLELGTQWLALRRADDEARDALGRCLACDSRSPQRLNHATLPSVAALATALRSGRAARREQLSRLKDQRLTRALPLWVGTLADVDDLLPPVAGLFDVVILDEASSIDQPLAASTLLRGRRAVIAGDPQQLRHVSFVADVQLAAAILAQGLDAAPTLAARLDVRRNSVFDLAAGATPVLVLDEHYRCDPHLVEFVFQRLYEGRVRVATRSPRTESRRCVSVVQVTGKRDQEGVVAAEVAWVVARLRALRHDGATSVGVVTPFRAQADALEAAVLGAFTADDLEALDLRVGTVHAFQGNERDIVIASLGVGPSEGGASWRFVEDSHLFAVMMTRARTNLTVLLSTDPPPDGLLADYLAQADHPPGPPRPARPLAAWASSVADDLEAAGVAIQRAYPTGRQVVDVCAADESRSLALECSVHPGGVDAHIDQHLALLRRGWEFLEAFQSRWGDRRAELVVELAAELRPRRDGGATGFPL
ncbi:MAG: DEAD/DEAH box helicase [Acidimicrobiales bacterium]